MRSFDGEFDTDQERNVLSDAELVTILEDDGRAIVEKYRGRAHAILYMMVWAGIFGDRDKIYAGDPGHDQFMRLCSRKILGDPANIKSYLTQIAGDGVDAPAVYTRLPGLRSAVARDGGSLGAELNDVIEFGLPASHPAPQENRRRWPNTTAPGSRRAAGARSGTRFQRKSGGSAR